MRRLLPTLTGVALLAGCSTDATREARLSFDDLPELLAQIDAADGVRVYEGLPHPNLEQDLFQEESARTKTLEIDGHRFYAVAVSVVPEKLAVLQKAVADPSLYEAYPDPDAEKACGGFHPDWCLVVDKGEESFHFHFCFGCHDLVVFEDGKMRMWCEFKDVEALVNLLQPLRTNRPKGVLTFQ
jgi:hypothetical protein